MQQKFFDILIFQSYICKIMSHAQYFVEYFHVSYVWTSHAICQKSGKKPGWRMQHKILNPALKGLNLATRNSSPRLLCRQTLNLIMMMMMMFLAPSQRSRFACKLTRRRHQKFVCMYVCSTSQIQLKRYISKIVIFHTPPAFDTPVRGVLSKQCHKV